MDGLLVVDKPIGPSSHDVVARVRRTLKERRVGHTGTLDPRASGVLPLVVGKATRLARFLSGDDKCYEAVVRLGFCTNTYDSAGWPAGAVYQGARPGRGSIDAALDAFRGTFLQQPPAYSAKKVGGEPSYKLARRADRKRRSADHLAGPDPAEVPLEPACVSTSVLEVTSIDGDFVTLLIECSAGFYVRSLAHDLGLRLGTGAHLHALRRTRSGMATLEEAVSLAQLEDPVNGRPAAESAVIPLSMMLPALPTRVLTSEGVRHARNGLRLGASDFASGVASLVQPAHRVTPVTSGHPIDAVKLLDLDGNLIGLGAATSSPELLHPFVVLV